MKRFSTNDIPRAGNKKQKTQNVIQTIQCDDSQQEQELIRFDQPREEEKVSKYKVAPWMTKKTRDINDSLLRFHNEIIQFCQYVSPTEAEQKLKQLAFQELVELIHGVEPSCEVMPFGSYATGLYLPDGDVDVAVIVQTYDQRKIYQAIHSAVLKSDLYEEIEYIRKSKVPLIKLVRIEGGVQFDISVNKMDGIKQIAEVKKMMNCYPEFRYLAVVLKCALKIRGLGETYSGGLGSFLLFCMLLVYLREMQNRKKYYTLSQHLLRFMEYYAISNDWSRKRVYVATGMKEDRREEHLLSFMSPQDPAHDIGKGAFRIKDVFGVFKNRFRMIQGKNFKKGQSILKQLVNPNESEFVYLKQK